MAIICQLFMFGDSSEQINQCWLHHCSKYVENHVLETRMNPNIYCYFSNTNKHKQYFSNHNMWKEKKWPKELHMGDHCRSVEAQSQVSWLGQWHNSPATKWRFNTRNTHLTSFNHLRTNNTTIKQAMRSYIYIYRFTLEWATSFAWETKVGSLTLHCASELYHPVIAMGKSHINAG